MHDSKKFAIELHNEFKPSWSLEETIEFVWQLKLNCMNETEIRTWFSKLRHNKDIEPEIIVEKLPDDLNRTDWR